jgi:hypothetical protein
MGDISLDTQSTSLWRWINPDSYRYYQAGLALDLFGDWTLVCVWGGLGTRRGNYRLTGGLSYTEGLRRISELEAYRQKRGYIRVSTFGNWTAQIAQMRETRGRSLPSKPKQMPRAMEMDLVLE